MTNPTQHRLSLLMSDSIGAAMPIYYIAIGLACILYQQVSASIQLMRFRPSDVNETNKKYDHSNGDSDGENHGKSSPCANTYKHAQDCTCIYRVAQKSKPITNDQKIVLYRIKACQ